MTHIRSRHLAAARRSGATAGLVWSATVGLALLAAAPLAGQEDDGAPEPGAAAASRVAPRPSLRAVPLMGGIVVDGTAGDAAWERAPLTSGFVQGEPVEGVPAEEDTEVRVLLGEDALFVFARMHDSRPQGIGDQLVRRDGRGSFDWFRVSLDPNLDGRTGYAFQVSAAGVQTDQYLYDDGREDRAWDAVWESAVRRDSLGWTAELRIPLSQIRYESSADPQAWGVNFARRRLQTNETSYFALRSRLREGTVSQFGRLQGVEVPETARRIEARPYLLSSLHSGPAEDGDPFFDGTEAAARVGGDVSVGLGSAFTVNATLNPDFGQVEADPAVINLSAFETFLEERRPFFVEDAQILDFGLSGRENTLFHSRRIGRSPRGRAPEGADHTSAPDAATILGAAKVTGRTTSGLSVGALAAVTQREEGRAFFAEDGTFRDYLVEPRAEYGVVRLEQDFNGGASRIGGIVTALHRDLPADGSFDFLPSRAYSAGLRFDHQWSDRDWRLSGFVAGSHVRGDSTAILRIQRSSTHYRQRPDATRLEVDSTATTLTGAQWRLRLERQNGEHWTGSVWLSQLTPGFEINDLGYSRSRERLDGGFRIGYREIEPGSWYRTYDLTLFTYHNWSHEALDEAGSWAAWRSAHTSGRLNLSARAELANWWGADLNLSLVPDTWSHTATRGGPVMRDPGSVGLRAGFNTDRRKAVSFRGGFDVERSRADAGSEWGVSGSVSLRPSPRLELELEPRFSSSVDNAQYVTGTSALPFAPTFGRRYLFGELDRTTVSMETRLDWTFSPTLSLQLFAQPLLSSGDYVRYKQLRAARTFDFDPFEEGAAAEADGEVLCIGGRICTTPAAEGERTQHVDLDGDGRPDFDFRDRDFNVRSLVGNAVLRWEYRPGSTVFLVWQREQSGDGAVGDFRLDRDLDALLGAPADDRFIVKVDYWLGL